MPKYDYRCELNGQTVEISHAMNDANHRWGELCLLADIEAGGSPVRKIISGGFVATGVSPQASSNGCTVPTCCSSGACGLDA